nr:histone-lysine N-methyltransferase ATX2 [Solanum lycopersicum]
MAFPLTDSTLSPNDDTNAKQLLEEEERNQQVDGEDDDRERVTPLRYVPLCDVYSATSPYVGASGSKKVKAARKILPHLETEDHHKHSLTHHISSMSGRELPIIHFYTRRRKRKRHEPSFYDSLISRSVKLANGDRESGVDDGEGNEVGVKFKENQRRKERYSNPFSPQMKLGNFSNGNREDEGRDHEMVLNNKQKRKVGNSNQVPHPKKLANIFNGNIEDESEDKEKLIKSRDKQNKNVGDLKLVSHSVRLANSSKGNRIDEGETEDGEEEVVIKNKEKVENLEVVDFCIESERDDHGEYDGAVVVKHIMKKEKKRSKVVNSELEKNLGVEANVISLLDESCSRGTRNNAGKNKIDTNHGSNSKDFNSTGNMKEQKEHCILGNSLNKKCSGSIRTKKWVWLSFEGVDPKKFIGLQCKAYWPLDAVWYTGRITGYNSETGRHHVKYVDGDEEDLLLSNERIKFSVTLEEMNRLKLRPRDTSPETDVIGVDEMIVLAASLADCEALEPGDIIWAKLTGHAMWPAIVLDESCAGGCKGLNKVSGEKSVLVQFFGTHDFARVKLKQVISFLRGLLSSFHLKCKKPKFIQSLEEAKMYLSEQKLSEGMLWLQNSINADNNNENEENEGSSDSEDEGLRKKLEEVRSCPLELGDLKIVSLGKIVEDSELFRDEEFIWPEGYTAVRKLPSVTDPSVRVSYKMEVLRDPDFRTRPLFRVTSDSREQFKGSSPSACWNKVYKQMRKTQVDNFDESISSRKSERTFGSGSHMFGFSHPEISKLIKELSKSKILAKSLKLASSKNQDLPAGYRSVRVKWKDLDKCNVCHMDEEYENNLFLQCDKCRMMVHARCYGEREPMDGVLWLCNLCRPGAPVVPPPCCLCPVIGGAMKPTTDGRWAHLACAIWIPETCLSDIKKMEPIDGLSRINKDRWKLLCSICSVPYGACIQCSNPVCRVAYHPLCARAAGFCVELEDEDRLHLIPMDDDELDQCIRLLSFCKKHRAVSNERPAVDECVGQKACEYSDYVPPPNPSGCARSEPYNYFGRRGRKEPEVLTAASLKRLYVENRPYLVGGHSQHDQSSNTLSSSCAGSKHTFDLQKLRCSQLTSRSIVSMVEKYNYMKETLGQRLAFGKSGIHGFGIFAKLPQKAGDMVIEYTGELVRPPIADRREHLIYNSLVGAGTYMFRIDDQRVIDATRAGSIAHLINHSCEPNCYSRVISVNSIDHIIIFSKRDIEQWEELTYDYRFLSIDEQLACYCGFPRCRGVVNDTEAEERMAKLYAPRSELIDWEGE